MAQRFAYIWKYIDTEICHTCWALNWWQGDSLEHDSWWEHLLSINVDDRTILLSIIIDHLDIGIPVSDPVQTNKIFKNSPYSCCSPLFAHSMQSPWVVARLERLLHFAHFARSLLVAGFANLRQLVPPWSQQAAVPSGLWHSLILSQSKQRAALGRFFPHCCCSWSV